MTTVRACAGVQAEESQAKQRRLEARTTARRLASLLTGLVTDNTDLELARLKSYALCWTVDLETVRVPVTALAACPAAHRVWP